MTRKQWQDDTPYQTLDRNLKRLGLSMLAGAVIDVALALLLLLFPSQISALMDVGTAQQALYLRFLPLVHLVFPCFCIFAWMDAKRNVAIVSAAIIARLVYALYVFALVLTRSISWVWTWIGAVSLGLAISHYVLLRKSDFAFWEVFSRAGNPPGFKRR
jgi:hypothetical protein